MVELSYEESLKGLFLFTKVYFGFKGKCFICEMNVSCEGVGVIIFENNLVVVVLV